ncbi:MAG: hypothetical protein HY221_00880, partial [Candidatus Sungbacteria bacterium]|nr:hypothetical protein [Candidatus Sungbacteria bacterium]
MELAQLKQLLKGKALLLLTGPNGAGKGTIADLLLKDTSLGIEKVCLHTTNPVRSNEGSEKEYFYISQE